MLAKRAGHVSEELGGRLFTAGVDKNGQNSCELFDPHAQKSIEAAPMDRPGLIYASSKLSENTAVISGTSSGIGFGSNLSEISVFDIRVNKWSILSAKLSNIRRSTRLQVTLDSNTIIVLGGYSDENGNNVEVVDLRV
eukprot:TRINITY_DN1832_c0_g1_i1.p2 TRINITY_DN1832_c0_g1~~TRINITY_DN1832_c0_g1_i1.p2  ORF type:complete len:138 (+),score=22.77 TRINITY_DN1832_c0_g1_i1:222-635(+)